MTQISQMKDPRTYAIIGAAMEVHKQLGNGFLEAVYQEALAIEFEARKIPFLREVKLTVSYKGFQLNARYRADFLAFDSIIVELKATAGLSGTDQAQLINYLRAANQRVGLLINFGTPALEYRRMVN